MSMWPLAGTRVLEAADGIAAPLCGRLLADAGASVTAVDLHRPEPPEPSPAWRAYLRAGKRVVVEERAVELLGEADLLLTSLTHDRAAPLGLDCPTVLAAHPHLIAVCVTPFGQSGPYTGLLGDDVVVSALSGLADCTPGFPDRQERMDDPPVQSRAPLTEAAGALVAAVAACGALLARLRGVPGPRHVEVASLEAVASMLVNEWGTTAYGGGVRGRRPGRMDQEPNSYLPCKDGWVNVAAMTPAYWEILVELMGSPEWAGADEYATPESRSEHLESLLQRLREWAATVTGRAFLAAAQARSLPCCASLELRDAIASEHVRAVRSVRLVDGRVFPADPIVVDGARRERPPEGPTPRLPLPAGGAAGAGPLAGVRVLDLTQFLAGPFACQTLAALGAEVIVVESATRLVSRGFGPFGGEPKHDASMNFNHCNRGKRSVQLNLKTDGGRRMLTELVRGSDVVVENFSRRAAERLGLVYDELARLREDVILASISAFGRAGPWGDYVALHSGVILLSGLASVTRDEVGRPRMVGSALPDTLSGTYIALAIEQALAQRELTGRGCRVELSMLDVSLTCMGGLVAEAEREETYATHSARFLRCAEREHFVAVSDPEEATRAAAEVARRTPREAMQALQAAGIRAGAVQDLAEVMADPHLRARGFVLDDDHPVVGPRPVPAVAWLYDGARPRLGHAPLLGADTDEVLGRVAGAGATDLRELRAEGALT